MRRQKKIEENVNDFFYTKMLHEIDPLHYFEGSFASYWKGGSFFGYKEIIPLIFWVNDNKIDLIFDKADKLIVFRKYRSKDTPIQPDDSVHSLTFMSGNISYNPVICCGLPETEPSIREGMDGGSRLRSQPTIAPSTPPRSPKPARQRASLVCMTSVT